MSKHKRFRKILKNCTKQKQWYMILKFMKDNELTLNFIIDKDRQQNIIHMLSKKLAFKELKLFLKMDYDFTAVDRKHNTALHLCLNQSLKLGYLNDVNNYWKLFTDQNEEVKFISNKKGVTPMDLLKTVSDKVNSIHAKYNQQANGWERDLAEEAYNEYMDDWGKYENDFYGDYGDYETHDDWSSRIYHEYKNKQRNRYNTQATDKSNDDSNRAFSAEQETNTTQQENYDKLRQIRQQRMDYEHYKINWLKFENFVKEVNKNSLESNSNSQISLKMIPKIPTNYSLLIILRNYFSDDNEAIKKELKMLQIAWHPDRFFNRCGQLISAENTDEIKSIVVSMSQLVNQAIGEIN